MKIFKQILFTVTIVIGLALTASAQQNDSKKPPPKEPPPIIIPKEKPKEDKPKDDHDKKGKKPEVSFLSLLNENEVSFV